MPSAGTAPGLSKAAVNVTSHQGSHKLKPEVAVSARQGAHCFFWIVGLVALNSVFEILGSHVHRFTGLGLSEVVALAQPSGISVTQVIVTFWVACGLLLIGHLAAEGRKLAFAAGMAAYAADAALMVAVGDYLGAIFHGLMLYGIYRGFAALGQLNSDPCKVPLAAHAD